ncbi:hemoglobin [Deinococcus metalli]|nr:group III truncated hemoglobin [Deinococcus metalli]MBB5375022.1 hemoglobin [Deinococcus metalli]
MPGPVLTTSPLPALASAQPATPGGLDTAAGLLVPHDGEPVLDVRERPERWALLWLIGAAVRQDVPVLAWGTGAALAGRALGAVIYPPGPVWPTEWSAPPRGAAAQREQGSVPVRWTLGRVTALAAPELPTAELDAFLAALPAWSSRRPGSDLEALGGPDALRRVVAAFYARARQDAVIGPIFAAHVHDWDAHVDRVTAFWSTVLGGGAQWRGHLGGAHAGLGLRSAHVERWLALWSQTVHAELAPDTAARLDARARVMARRLRGPPRAET